MVILMLLKNLSPVPPLNLPPKGSIMCDYFVFPVDSNKNFLVSPKFILKKNSFNKVLPRTLLIQR